MKKGIELYYIGNCTCMDIRLLSKILSNTITLEGKTKIFYADIISKITEFSIDYILENYIDISRNRKHIIFIESGIEYIFEINRVLYD